MPHKVMVVMPSSERQGGAELALWHLIRHGQNKGIEWTFLFFSPGQFVEETREAGVSVRVLDAGRMREPHKAAAFILQLSRILRQEKFDAVLGWMTKAHLYGGSAAALAGKPALWFQHGTPSPESKMDRLVARIPTKGIMTCSEAVAAAQRVLTPHVPTRVVYPAIDQDQYNPSLLPSPKEARRELRLPEEGPLIGIVGRMQRWKGIHVFVEAFPAILERHPDARGVIVGGKHDLEPNYEAFIEERVATLGLTNRIQRVGRQHNVPLWMQAMDVVVHASDNEPFGMVIIEAMALGKSVVAGDVGGPTEIITPEENGLLAPYGDPEKLAAAILRYLDDPAFASRVGKAARTRALDFTAEKYADNLIAALKELTGLPA